MKGISGVGEFLGIDRLQVRSELHESIPVGYQLIEGAIRI
jgi:hypothetical protein